MDEHDIKMDFLLQKENFRIWVAKKETFYCHRKQLQKQLRPGTQFVSSVKISVE